MQATNLDINEISCQGFHEFVVQDERAEFLARSPCGPWMNILLDGGSGDSPSMKVNLFDFTDTRARAGPSPHWFSKRVMFGGHRMPPWLCIMHLVCFSGIPRARRTYLVHPVASLENDDLVSRFLQRVCAGDARYAPSDDYETQHLGRPLGLVPQGSSWHVSCDGNEAWER